MIDVHGWAVEIAQSFYERAGAFPHVFPFPMSTEHPGLVAWVVQNPVDGRWIALNPHGGCAWGERSDPLPMRWERLAERDIVDRLVGD